MSLLAPLVAACAVALSTVSAVAQPAVRGAVQSGKQLVADDTPHLRSSAHGERHPEKHNQPIRGQNLKAQRGGSRLCRLDKPLFGASPARLKCYALAAYEPQPQTAFDESAMLGDPKMDHDDEILEELDVPDGVRDASEAVEVMRAWVADGALHVIFDPETFRHDVSEWGRLLGDVAQHISNAVELDGQMSRQEALTQIQDAIDLSVSANAVTMDGKIKGRTEH